MPKVSVIVPVYNVEKYLNKCLDSLINQTFNDFEIIIINDGSPDDSKQIIEKYKSKYNDFIKVINQSNQGLSASRNNGLKMASGAYIMFADSDDYLELNMLERMYSKITSEQADVVICGNNVVNENYQIISSTFPNNYESTDLTTQIILGNLSAWNKIIKKDLLDDSSLLFRSNVWYEDIDFSFKLLLKSQKTCILNENLYNYSLRDGSIMNSKNLVKNLDLIKAFDEIINYSKNVNLYDKYYKEIEFLVINHLYISCIVRILTNNNSTNSEKKVLLNTVLSYINKNFHDYKKNIYIKYLSSNRKIIFYLIRLKLYSLVKLVFKIKNRK